MLAIILILTIVTLAIMIPIMTLALCKAENELDEALDHPERLKIKEE